jgi:formate dehydrogenase major subunit
VGAARAGRLKALWAIGYDVALTNPNARATREALASLEFLVTQDLFLNEVSKFASVFLPAASSFEKDGTFMNAERRVQRVRQAAAPKGNSRPDWQIICDVARAMGKGEQFAFESPAEVWEEIRAVWPAGRGITYDRLEHGGVQWPCPTAEHPGTSILHVESFAGSPRAPLQRVPFVRTAEAVSEEFPYLLITGRTLYQFNAGTMTRRTPNRVLREHDDVHVSPDDAGRLQVAEGARVRLRSRYGEAIVPVRIDASVPAGQLFTTFHCADAMINELTGNERDRDVGTPEYKVTAVRIDVL